MIDDQFKLFFLHNRQVSRFCSLEDATRIDTNLAPSIDKVGTVADQAANFNKFRPRRLREASAALLRAPIGHAGLAVKIGWLLTKSAFGALVLKIREDCIDFTTTCWH